MNNYHYKYTHTKFQSATSSIVMSCVCIRDLSKSVKCQIKKSNRFPKNIPTRLGVQFSHCLPSTNNCLQESKRQNRESWIIIRCKLDNYWKIRTPSCNSTYGN